MVATGGSSVFLNKTKIIWNLQLHIPWSGSLFTVSLSNWNWSVREARQEPKLGHARRALSPIRHPFSPILTIAFMIWLVYKYSKLKFCQSIPHSHHLFIPWSFLSWTEGSSKGIIKPPVPYPGRTLDIHASDRLRGKWWKLLPPTLSNVQECVSVLVSGSRGPGSSPGRGHCVVFLGKTLHSHSASFQPGPSCSKAG